MFTPDIENAKAEIRLAEEEEETNFFLKALSPLLLVKVGHPGTWFIVW